MNIRDIQILDMLPPTTKKQRQRKASMIVGARQITNVLYIATCSNTINPDHACS